MWQRNPQQAGYGQRRSWFSPRLILAAVVALVSVVGYYANQSKNELTGEKQSVGLSEEEEVAMGLQARGEMAAQHGGLHPDQKLQDLIDKVGRRLVTQTQVQKSDYPFEFHLLADEEMINAFALPGGQIFMTAGLLKRLDTEGQVAGVLGHEIGHVIERHGAEHLAKAQLTQGLTGAAVIASYDPNNPASRNTAAVAAAVGQLVNMKYGRNDELESDRWGVTLLAEAGYDPRSVIRVMEVLAEASKGRGAPPEFFSTHPNPDRRIERIKQAIDEQFPNGVPSGLEP